jgi:phosphodiesterase/alkaline phosphatase D-like protein
MNQKFIKTKVSKIHFLFIFCSIALQFCNQNEVLHFWAGALQPTSVKVTVKLNVPNTQVRLVASTSPYFSNPINGAVGKSDSDNKTIISLSITGLSPNTKYYYAVEIDGKLDTSSDDIGSLVTPSDSAFSFCFTLGSCLNSNSHHPVFSRMLEKRPLFFLQSGDFHYDDPNSAYNINVHRLPYEHLISNRTYSHFFKHIPLVYIWDDHDYSGNNSDSTAAGKINARIAYREYVPHYAFGTPINEINAPIYQSFVIGRVYFILTDLRSSRRKPTMMGAIQKQWFKQQCLYAKSNKLLIAWVSTVPYEGTVPDSWGGFSAERTELANFFRDNQINNLFILSGDAHMVAIDDGRHSDFSTNHSNPFKYPILQAAALNESGSTKGGTYSEGAFPNPNDSYGQYGLVEVHDNGDNTIRITMTGYRVNYGGKENKLVSYAFNRKCR